MEPIPRHYVDEVLQWRYEKAIDLGLSRPLARKLAESDADLNEAAARILALVESGCEPNLAGRIVV